MAKKLRLPETNEEWLDERVHSVGGSEVAAVMGISRFKSPRDVWQDKVYPEFAKQVDNRFTRIGRKLEQTVADLFCEETGEKVYKSNFRYMDDEYPYFTANIDRFVYKDSALLECKTTSAYNAEEWDGGDIPAEYYAQVQWYMGILDRPKTYVAVLIGGNDFRVKVVERDSAYIKNMREKVADFWNRYVVTRQMPDPVGMDKGGIIERRAKQIGVDGVDENPVDLSDKLESRLVERQQAKKMVAECNELIKQVDCEILEEMGLSEKGLSEAYTVTCKPRVTHSLDTKKLKAEHPEMVGDYEKTSTSWVITVKENKDGNK